jgi:LmbE family N-acetylglucosaminyl deacetylase
MSAGCILAVFAHPDDESLLAAGTLARCAEAGASVVLVSATRGERGPSHQRRAATPAALARVRERELRAAGRAIGATAVECMDFPDGELAWVDRARLETELAAVLRRWSPDAVLTFGPEGLYWHPDHIAVHDAVSAAVDAVAAEGLAPRLEYATWPEGWMARMVAAVGARGLPTDFFGLPPHAFGSPAASITTVRDVRPFLGRKLRALRSHRSQLRACRLLRAIPHDLALEFLGREFFVTARPGRAPRRLLGPVAPPKRRPRTKPAAVQPSAARRGRGRRSSATRARVIVLGMAGRTPFAGVAWQALHYLEAFRRAGCDVHYVEDTGDWPYDPDRNTITDDCTYTAAFIARLMRWAGFEDRWAYRAPVPDRRVYGLSASGLQRILEGADALVNLCGATVLTAEHLRVPVRVYLETDPVLPQIEAAQGRQFTIDLLNAHTHHLTFGENIGSPDCGVPLGPFRYLPTRQPVVLEWWAPGPATGKARSARDSRFTTVASWHQSGKDIAWNGDTYTWSKHHEFLKLIDLPGRTPDAIELALAAVDREAIALLTAKGWSVVDALALSKDILPYRRYIRGSRGEFTVAKDQNIRLRSGWFSDRSACYLAAGRPVITQETGFSRILPTGEGLFAFTRLEDVLSAMDAIRSDYERQSRAARAIAAEYFEAEKVARAFLTQASL